MIRIKFNQKVYRVGSSLVISIPKEIRYSLNINENTRFNIWVDDRGNIILEKCGSSEDKNENLKIK